jgi:glucose-1-phosphate adenylyltransferase
MNAAGLIFSNIHDQSIPQLTGNRTMASVPFGCRYRLIDFALSNMVNSDITKIGIITHDNYQSLLDHIGTGKDWDLARRSGGIKILPPFITSYTGPEANKLYSTRLEALMGVMSFIRRCNEDNIVMSDCDAICNINISEALKQHEETEADITIIGAKLNYGDHTNNTKLIELETDADGKLLGVSRGKPAVDSEVSTNIVIVKRSYLITALNEASSRGYSHFYMDLISKNIGKDKFFVYHHTGYYNIIGSLEAYFSCNMELLDPVKRRELFECPGYPIYTKVRNSAPTKYTENARVKNSYIADGCVIDGVVENSIIFRGVKVGKGAVIKNAIILQDTYIGSDVTLNCVITDKNVVINDGRMLSGHQTMPFFIGKGMRV